jgi:hypothetical protein
VVEPEVQSVAMLWRQRAVPSSHLDLRQNLDGLLLFIMRNNLREKINRHPLPEYN